MRLIFILVFLSAALTTNLVSADSDDSTADSGNWRVAKAAKLIKKERYQKAVKELRKALKKDKENADAWNLLGFASRNMGDLETSADAYAKALALEPDHKGALEYQGELFITLGTIDKAKDNLAKLTALCPSGCEERSDLEEALAKLQ